MGLSEAQKYCALGRGLNHNSGCNNLMRAAVRQMDLFAWPYHRVLQLSCTIADLAGAEAIQAQHLAEALQYRPRAMV
jgi:magnesium chelatase family protein